MTWARRLFNLGQDDGAAAVDQELLRFHSGFVARAEALRRTADLAPPASEVELQSLAERQVRVADQLAAILRERDVAIPPRGPTALQSPGPNHWARLVRDLEEHQKARGEVRDATTWMPDIDTDLSSLLRELGRLLDGSLLTLRLQIARADPQALD